MNREGAFVLGIVVGGAAVLSIVITLLSALIAVALAAGLGCMTLALLRARMTIHELRQDAHIQARQLNRRRIAD